MLQYSLEKRTFIFKTPSGTSRGVLSEKHAWFISIWDDSIPEVIGLGECSIIPGLSPDFFDFDSYEKQIHQFCSIYIQNLTLKDFEEHLFYETDLFEALQKFPSILFGLETALQDLAHGGKKMLFESSFTRKEAQIPINGLIWMGSEAFMQQQIAEKLQQNYSCIKMKIGAIDFEREFEILKSIRSKNEDLILRVDANGAFSFDEALEKMAQLASLNIHSIEQPIKAGNWLQMAHLCQETKLPIALDEELIEIFSREEKINLLDTIKPQYIILKPSLHGGFYGCKEWIELAETRNIPWWMTSALESNVGLNAIAQFTATFENNLHQGLGTGSLYVENTESNLVIENGFLRIS
ncbi:MAG: o-succinylbenzoate synthase [Flavobacteriia bacterium]|jgi:o-succinylbenzoate synthase